MAAGPRTGAYAKPMRDKKVVDVNTAVEEPKATWECPDCGEEVTGTPREIADTSQEHYREHRLEDVK